MRTSLLIAALFSLAGTASANESFDAIFSRANDAYFARDYEQALSAYHDLLAAGVRDPDIYFNIGTTHAAAGDLGSAILAFERTLRLRPGDEGAQAGITEAYHAIGQRRADAEGEATVRPDPSVFEALVSPFTLNGLGWAWLITLALTCLLWIGRRLSGTAPHTLQLALAIAVPLAFLLSVVSGFAVAAKDEWFHDGSAAIILAPQASLLSSPDRRAPATGRVHEGERVQLLSDDGRWSRIRLGNGTEGYLTTPEVGSIRIPADSR